MFTTYIIHVVKHFQHIFIFKNLSASYNGNQNSKLDVDLYGLGNNWTIGEWKMLVMHMPIIHESYIISIVIRLEFTLSSHRTK